MGIPEWLKTMPGNPEFGMKLGGIRGGLVKHLGKFGWCCVDVHGHSWFVPRSGRTLPATSLVRKVSKTKAVEAAPGFNLIYSVPSLDSKDIYHQITTVPGEGGGRSMGI